MFVSWFGVKNKLEKDGNGIGTREGVCVWMGEGKGRNGSIKGGGEMKLGGKGKEGIWLP